jgi:YhcH/YjgK/YiaL family protein
MIVGKREELHLYKGLGDGLAKGIDFVLNFDLSVNDGRYEIDGDKVYAMVSSGQTKISTEPVYEAHRKYIDLQYIISGSENLGYASVGDCEIDCPYNEEKDFLMVRGEGSEIKVCQDDFYIAFPCDGHRPMCSDCPAEIRKLIVKVAV